MSETTFTFRVDDSLKTQFTNAAKKHDRTTSQLLRDFMRDYVKRQQEETEYNAWFRRQVRTGIDSANAGNLISDDVVETEFAERRMGARHKPDAES